MGKMDVAEFVRLNTDFFNKERAYGDLLKKINGEKNDLMNELYYFSETLNLAQRISLLAELKKRDDVKLYFINDLASDLDSMIKEYLSLSRSQWNACDFSFSNYVDGNACFTVKHDFGFFNNYSDGVLSDETLKKLQKLLENCGENMIVSIEVKSGLHEVYDEVYGGMDLADFVEKNCTANKLSKTYRKCVRELGNMDSSE